MIGLDQLGAEFPSPQTGDSEPVLAPGRNCGSCSLCCKVCAVIELGKPAGQWCTHASPGSGCKIHDRRPQGCRQFFCGWLLDPALGPEWKPEVSRFVLTANIRAFTVVLDPGTPLAWKRAPYYARLKQLSERLFAANKRVVVALKEHITVVLPDRDVPLGVVPPGVDIAIWREGSSYGAKLLAPRNDTGSVE